MGSKAVAYSKILAGLFFIFSMLVILVVPTQAQSGPRWNASYWNNTSLSGTPALQRVELSAPNFNWGEGSPLPGIIQDDQFSARFTRSMNLSPGTYQFTVKADDGVRFWINGQLLVDQWFDSPALPFVVEIELPGGVTQFVASYYENVGGAQVSITGTRLDGTTGGSGGGGGSGGSGITARVDTNYLNMRSGPGVDFEVIEVLRQGTFLELTGNQQDYWVEVETPTGSVGWVSSRYLNFNLQFTVE